MGRWCSLVCRKSNECIYAVAVGPLFSAEVGKKIKIRQREGCFVGFGF